ncbi:MAG: hypothetical protein WBX15_13755 [Thermoanaerobaculia bacterium]
MKQISDCTGILDWIPSSALRRDSVLRHADDVYAELQWKRSFGAIAEAETFEAKWSLKLEGFLFRQWVTIRKPGESMPVAMFQASPSFNGTLEFPDGHRYHWDSNFWLTRWIWSDTRGMELIRMQRHLSLRTEGCVEVVSDESIGNPDLPLLTVLGWYLIVLVTDLRPG